MKTLKVVEFLRQDSNNLEVLKKPPYNLEIREGVAETWSQSLVLLKYNQISSDFSQEIVRECRGLILDRDNNWFPVCHAMDKFFNCLEPHSDKVDFSSARILAKIDGSLIKIYRFKNEWRVATNGTIDARVVPVPYNLGDEIETFFDLFLAGVLKYFSSWEEFTSELSRIFGTKEGTTLCFEVVGPHNKVVVSYPEPDVYFLGSRDAQGWEQNVNFPGMQAPKSYAFSSQEETLEFAKTLDHQHEGFVVVDKNFKRVKIKGILYLKLHSMKGEQGQYTADKIYDILMENESEEILAYFPEFKILFNKVETRIKEIKKEITEDWDKFWKLNDQFSTRKDQALWIKENTKYPDFFFGALDGKYISVEDYMRTAKNVNYKRLRVEAPKQVEE